MKCTRYTVLLLTLLSVTPTSQARIDNLIEEELTEDSQFKITSNTFLEIEKFKGYKINNKKVFDKISPTVQLAINPVNSKWSYFMEYKFSMRNYTTNLHSENTSYNNNRFQLQVNRKLYQGDKATFNLSLVYRKESNDVKGGMPEKNAYHSYWLIPGGSYQFTQSLSFVFWDAGYYYDNMFSGPSYNDWEWESEHGLQYKFSDQFTAKIMYYTDRAWNAHGDKTGEQNQIRGYFPTTLNEKWNILPYFRLFLNEKNYDPTTGKITNSTDAGGLRLGLIVNYNLTPRTTLWTNIAWEQTKWEHSKNSDRVKRTYGNDNTQDFRFYSVGIRYAW